MVDRYEVDCDKGIIDRHPSGDYVLYSEYDELEDECYRLEYKYNTLVKKLADIYRDA